MTKEESKQRAIHLGWRVVMELDGPGDANSGSYRGGVELDSKEFGEISEIMWNVYKGMFNREVGIYNDGALV